MNGNPAINPIGDCITYMIVFTSAFAATLMLFGIYHMMWKTKRQPNLFRQGYPRYDHRKVDAPFYGEPIRVRDTTTGWGFFFLAVCVALAGWLAQ